MKFINNVSELLEYIIKPTTGVCPRCGLSDADFELEGRFGCPECYSYFGAEVQKYVVPYHNADMHVGKRPRKLKLNLQELRLKLQCAIEQEQYEEAAKISQYIKELSDANSKD